MGDAFDNYDQVWTNLIPETAVECYKLQINVNYKTSIQLIDKMNT
jgi:hypothetical protein